MGTVELFVSAGRFLVGIGVALGMITVGVLSAAWAATVGHVPIVVGGVVLISVGVGLGLWAEYSRRIAFRTHSR